MPSPFLPLYPLILLIYPMISLRPTLLDIVSSLILHKHTIQEPYNIPLGLPNSILLLFSTFFPHLHLVIHVVANKVTYMLMYQSKN